MVSRDAQQGISDQDSGPKGLIRVGQIIREGREHRGLSCEQLASSLHMGVEQLAALESGASQRLPEPVFVKAMVRRLAGHLRLDADELVAELGPTKRAVSSISALNAPLPPGTASLDSRSPQRRPLVLLFALMLVGGGASYTLWQGSLGQGTSPLPKDGTSVMASDQTPETAAVETAVIETPSTETAVTESPASPAPDPALPAVVLVELSSKEPVWIALRRGEDIEFQGILEKPLSIDEPSAVELWSQRPDLVTVSVTDQEPRSVSDSREDRWHRLIPEL